MTGKSVLILSDHSKSTPIWVDAFLQRGLDATSISSPEEAYRRWREDLPMLTVVDLSLPFDDCLEVCRRLLDIAHVPILLILSTAGTDEIIQVYRAGVTECLIQPASPAVILLKALAWSMRSDFTLAEPMHEWHRTDSLASF